MTSKRFGGDNLAGYVFIGPWLLGFFGFTIVPMAASLVLSFTKYDILSAPNWVGLQNYVSILSGDKRFSAALGVTFLYVGVHVPFRLAFALGVAMLFRRPRRMVNVYRALFYIPSVIGGSVAVAVMWRQLFGAEGALNALLRSLGLMTRPISWIGNPDTALWSLIVLAVWQFGSPMLIFLAGLRQIPQSLYEAAAIDGAGRWQQFIRITLPALSPIIFFNFIMQTISGFKAFTQAYVVTEGGPFDKTLFYALYLFQQAFVYYAMGYGAALAWILLVIIAAFTAIIFKSSSYWVFYESSEKM
jgi:multiple sugar transport system permease protein